MANGAPVENNPRIDLYKLRAAEYRDRYESMRSLEWKVLFQAYVGYAAIATVFWHCHKILDWQVSRMAMTVTCVFFLATQYLCFRIQERLISFNVTYENYMKELYGLAGIDLNFDPGPGTNNLSHKYFWTYDIQLLLAGITSGGLLWFENSFAVNAQCYFVSLATLMVVWVAVLRGWAEWYRKHING
jgi:hypothetical protein